MIISTCGFGSTGSSAVADYLLECDGVQVFDNIEFSLATMADGLEDLEFHLMKQHSRTTSCRFAIQRFKKAINESIREWSVCTKISPKTIHEYTDDFIDAITQIKFVGYSPSIDKKHFDFFRHYFGYSLWLNRILLTLEKKKIVQKNIDCYPFEEVEISIEPENFYYDARKYVMKLLSAMGCDFSKKIVMDQAFSGENPVKSFPYFEDPYAIVVDRDPRDQYIFTKKVLLSRGRYIPTDTVEKFVKYYRLLRENQPYKKPHERVLCVRFEDMVYDYDNATKKIDTFVSVKNNQKRTVFVPELSAANTNLIRKFPEFKEDVRYIEKELPEYLFPFDKYPEIRSTTEMFYGKSPLNKQ